MTPAVPTDARTRCAWCGNDPLLIAYHDQEWGVPVCDDKRLFEMLILEGAQAGLSWLTILKKRENYRAALHDFDPDILAAFTAADVERLLHNSGIVRNRLKLEAIGKNARAVRAIQNEFGSLAHFVWAFVDGVPQQHHRNTRHDIPTRSPQSDALSRALKQRGCNFVGSTICYAFMQAVGMVNDHSVDCFRHPQIRQMIETMPRANGSPARP